LSPGARRIGAALALTFAVVAPAAAMDALPLAFDDVVARADCIVHGTVAEVAPGRDADGIPATWITLDVAESLKGGVGSRLVFKQVGVPAPLADGTLLRVPGLPRYHTGDEVVLFLHRPSGRGFTSPVGLGQGIFRVERRGADRMILPRSGAAAAEALPVFLDRVRERAAR
jgi:hypothetical protein